MVDGAMLADYWGGKPATIEQMINDVLRREGGFTDRPADHGGATNLGITQKTLANYWGKPATIDDVKALTEGLAREIYWIIYYREPHIGLLPGLIQPIIFDCAVNSGPAQAIRLLQQTCNACGEIIAVDGKVGPQTIRSAEACCRERGNWFVMALLTRRETYYRGVARANPTQKVFLAGWLNRIAEFAPTTVELRQ